MPYASDVRPIAGAKISGEIGSHRSYATQMFIQLVFMPLTIFVLTDMGKGFVIGLVAHIFHANTLTVSKREPAASPFYDNPSLSCNSAIMAGSSGGVFCLPLCSNSISSASTISLPSWVLTACSGVLFFRMGIFWLIQSR